MKSKKEPLLDKTKLPAHIAFIMDGNGRWAKKRLLPRKVGHKFGVETIKKITKQIYALGIKYITMYAFSTENRFRPKEEVDALTELIEEFFHSSLDDFKKDEISLKIIGDITFFPQKTQQIIEKGIKELECFEEKVLVLALNYGSRDEIIRAVNKAVKNNQEVDEQSFSRLLYTADMPDPDLIIRTGGEKRLSNFLTYQSAYAELIFLDTLWPDFNKKTLIKALEEYSLRDRRYGKVK